jgi:hypothetical protein
MEVSVTLYGIIVVLLLSLVYLWVLGPDALRSAVLRSHARKIGLGD